jgi:hypothetical protein
VTTLDRLDERLHAAVNSLDGERLGRGLIVVGSAMAAGSALTLAALGLGVQVGYFLFGDIL